MLTHGEPGKNGETGGEHANTDNEAGESAWILGSIRNRRSIQLQARRIKAFAQGTGGAVCWERDKGPGYHGGFVNAGRLIGW